MSAPLATRRHPYTAAALLAGALVLHLLFVTAPGWEFDVQNFGTWMRLAIEHGVTYLSDFAQCIYPPGYLYVLKALGVLWMALSGGPLPAAGSGWSRFLVKLVPILANVATAWVLYRLALAQAGVDARRALIVMAAYAFNPAMLFISAVWGQADGLISLLLLPAAWAVGRRRFATGLALATAAVLVKPQAAVVGPVLLLAVFRLGGLGGVFAAVRGAAMTFLALLLPYYVTGRTEALITAVLSGTSGFFPFVSMNAHNVWWLGAGVGARELSDVMRFGNGLLTYRSVGSLMFATATLLILWRLWRDFDREREPLPALFEACALQVFSVYLFPTEMHERYILPALVFLAALCIWNPRMWWLYGMASVTTVLSLASTLHAGYPQGMGRFAALVPVALLRPDRVETLVYSAVFTALFAVLLLWTPDVRFRWSAPAVAALVALATIGVAHVPLRAAVQLSEWPPTSQSQDWGSLQHGHSVDGNRLSVGSFIFRQGIGTHANSRLTYHLNRAFETFDTAFGVDDEANRGQMIRFRILADGQVLYDSDNTPALHNPRHARVSVHGADFLTLEVLDGGDGINYDHADWLQPVLLR